MKKALLIEPNYTNKFPPVGLMKIATYYRKKKGWEVVFFKGDLKMFVIERIVDKLICQLCEDDASGADWHIYKHQLCEYVRTRKSSHLESLPIEQSESSFLLKSHIVDAKDFYWKGLWKQHPEWDRVFVTTLFTFYWDITIDTIQFAKQLVKKPEGLMVGGVLASIQPDEIEAATGVKPHVGILRPGDLDRCDKQKIDELELDYSILEEIDYRYPMNDAYYRYTTRGCIRHCPFCAVPVLEPEYQSYIPLKERIDKIDATYGKQKDLLLMDNNVLASKDFPKIIDEIIACGFEKGAVLKKENELEITIRNLKNGLNDRAFIRKAWHLIDSFYDSLKGEESYQIYCIREKYHITYLLSSTKENLIAAYEELKEIYAQHHKPGLGRRRYVDFNQGVDARLFTEENVKLLSKIAIRPLRIAFDDIKTKEQYVRAIEMSANEGLRDFSNYLLYNFKDHPDDLYERLRINVDMCERLNISIYSFPMKYHPIRKTAEMDEDYSHNRDYIGKLWNRKYIRAIQAILNSTKGMVGKGVEFFEKAFGTDINEYHKLLEMPEQMIIYRFFYEWLDTPEAHDSAITLLGSDTICQWSMQSWWQLFNKCQQELPQCVWNDILCTIHNNEIAQFETSDSNIRRLLSFYSFNSRKTILESGTSLYIMKQEYDKHPTIDPKRHRKYK